MLPAEGTNYLVVDPHPVRPFFMLWARATREGHLWVYREWPPVDQPVPGLGVLGAWAEQGGGHKQYDGKPGPAQRAIGWGFRQYKQEIARLEGWKIAEESGNRKPETGNLKPETGNLKPEDGRPGGMTEDEWVRSWGEFGPARETVFRRLMDARGANNKDMDGRGTKTLFESFDEWGLTFYETSGVDNQRRGELENRTAMINDALAYDASKPVDFFNMPKLHISKACKNLIFALQIYTGEDGGEGATKDPIDCLGWLLAKDCVFVEEARGGGRAGRGCY